MNPIDLVNPVALVKLREKFEKDKLKPKKTLKIPFAYNANNQLIDVSKANKSEQYKCSCGEPVKLRGGEKVTSHFYHIGEKVCSLESAIHKAYKAVFADIKKIKLPYFINETPLFEFDRVELEKKVGDFIPDAIGYMGDKQYLVEFAKTSFIGERKKAKIKKINLFCIEVTIDKSATTIEEIKNHLVKDVIYKDIINAPMYSEMEKIAVAFTKSMDELTLDNTILSRRNDKLESDNATLLRVLKGYTGCETVEEMSKLK